MNEINLFNVYDYVTYKFRDNILIVSWNNRDKNIDTLMCHERQPYHYQNDNTKKYNCQWIDELKNSISWKRGETIKIRINASRSGEFRITINPNPIDKIMRFVYEEIGEDGYLYISPYNRGFWPILEKCNCLYNDILDENDEPYVLK